MSKESDNREILIAQHLNSYDNIIASRPNKGTSFSDVHVQYNNRSSWLEVKMNHQDNIANPRVYYNKNQWKTRYITPVAISLVKDMNKCLKSLDFVHSISRYTKISIRDIMIPTLKSQMYDKNVVSKEDMKSFCTEYGSYILDDKNKDITSIIEEHYTKGKKEPAFYIQTGDSFYMISNTNPLCLSSDIPTINGYGKYRVRVSNRSDFYEIQAEIKLTEINDSQYSILPGSDKINPFL